MPRIRIAAPKLELEGMFIFLEFLLTLDKHDDFRRVTVSQEQGNLLRCFQIETTTKEALDSTRSLFILLT